MKETQLLSKIQDGLQEILGDALTGLYVHGSLALGCYCRDISDIDLIAVVERKLGQEDKLRLLAFFLSIRPECPDKGLEISVVLRSNCQSFTYPTPYELHYSPMWAAVAQKEPLRICGEEEKTDYDLAAHFAVLHKAGIALCGLSVSEVFGLIPRRFYVDSIRRDVQSAEADVMENPVSVILNLCRVLAFLKEGLVLSKAEGGQWGLHHVPEAYGELVCGVLNSYQNGAPWDLEAETACNFVKEMLARIEKLY